MDTSNTSHSESRMAPSAYCSAMTGIVRNRVLVPLKVIHTAAPDTTRLPRLPVDRRRRDARRPGRKLRLAARPPTRSDVVRHAKCKHAVDCCIWLNINFFTKRRATRVIYRLTVQTLPDGLETQFTPPDSHMTQTALFCRAWRAVWIGH